MKYKRQDRLIQEITILSDRVVSIDYLVNVFEVSRPSILEDLKIIRNKGYNVVKIEMGHYTIKELTTKELVEQVKAKNMASNRQCTKCVYYIAEFKDDYTVRHFGYGEVKVRPSCKAKPYAYVSHNPARLCRWYKEKQNVSN